MAMNVGKEIADLKQMTVRELREKYEAVFGEPTRAGNRDWLFKRIAWRIQALAEGDLSERARQRAEFLARDADLRTTAPRAPVAAPGGNGVSGPAAWNGARDAKLAPSLADERVPPPGTVLTRVYRGQAYHVVVRDDGFEYDGQVFRSLSAIAKIITGSHWNGLLFFNIAKPKTATAANGAGRKSGEVTGNGKAPVERARTVAKPKRRRETVDA
ncbi:MAG: hypothetical protein BroJett003_06110 [Planctomycetota bacterium]|nr:MAG: hypothetical protein BroJett003_06110 [Planctomycetota bacterium]